MNKTFKFKWSFLVLSIMIWFVIFSIMYWFINSSKPFDESGMLYSIMRNLYIPLWILLLLLVFIVLVPIPLSQIFKKNWIKLRKSFVPIYNVYILLWIIGVKKRLFSAVLRWIPMYIVLMFFTWMFSCACTCDYWGIQDWYMPRDCGYNTTNWFLHFASDIFWLFMSLWVIWFVVFMFSRLLKYCSNQKKLLNGENS